MSARDDNDLHKDGVRLDASEGQVVGAEVLPPDPNAPKPDPSLAMLEAGSMRVIGERAIAYLTGVAEKRIRPVSTPWPNVNRELGGGFWRGAHFLVGAPKAGKSQFAISAALHAAEQGHPVVYVALELDSRDVWARLAGIRSGHAWSRLVLGESRDGVAELEQIRAEHGSALDALPLHVIHGDAYGWTPEGLPALVDAARKLHATDLTPLVIVDFVQLVSGKERELRERIAKAGYAARMAAREHDAAIVLVSSTARENYGTTDAEADAGDEKRKRPKLGPPASTMPFLALGKESGELEYAADSVSVLVREKYDPARRASIVYLAVAGIRAKPQGSCGWARFAFNGTTFTDDEGPDFVNTKRPATAKTKPASDFGDDA